MMKQSLLHPVNLFFPWTHRALIAVLVQREISSRYRNSVAGVFWSVISPAFTLLVYTAVFTKVFAVKWPGSGNSPAESALLVFIGMTVFGLFSECILRAPMLVVSNVNFVKKINFPLEILPWVSLGTAGFHTLISSFIFLVFYGVTIGTPSPHFLLLPLVLTPAALIVLGFSWGLGALGVYFRDINQITAALLLPLMFLTPIFYPASALPLDLRLLIGAMNPLVDSIENARAVLFFGRAPSFSDWGTSVLLSGIFAALNLWLFQKSREGFSDVL
jgi:lipopolysaccharide transport system permease protein